MNDLSRDFERLRDEDLSLAPPFDSTRLAGAPLRRASRLAVGLAAAAVLAVTGVWLTRSTGVDEAGTGLAAVLTSGPHASWAAPTDFLLQLPGADLLRTTPALGAPPRMDGTADPVVGPRMDTERKGHERT